MAIPNKNTAKIDSQAAKDALEAAAGLVFVADADLAINEAIDLGKFEVTLTIQEPQSLQLLHDYFVALGYGVLYPGLGMRAGRQFWQPAQLFGIYWRQYWTGKNTPSLPLPARMTIVWL